MSYVVSFENVYKIYPPNTIALRGLSFSVKKNDWLVILGPNGAGKTTTLKIISTITRPSKGKVKVFGHDVSKDRDVIRSKLCIVPQEICLDPWFPLEKSLEFIARMHGINKKEAKKLVKSALKKVGLLGHERKLVEALSTGMMRRAQLAIAFIVDRPLILLDEPTLGVDIIGKFEIWELLRNELKNRTVLIATNDLIEAEKLGQKVLLINNGESIAFGNVNDIVRQQVGELTLRISLKSKDYIQSIIDKLKEEVSSEKLIYGKTKTISIVINSVEEAMMLLSALSDYSNIIESFGLDRFSLEDLFRKLINR